MRFWNRFKFLFQFRKSIPFLKEYFLSKKVNITTKLAAVGFIVLYIVFPFDLIPDFLLLAGMVDDVMIASLILQQIVRMAPKELKDKYDLT